MVLFLCVYMRERKGGGDWGEWEGWGEIVIFIVSSCFVRLFTVKPLRFLRVGALEIPITIIITLDYYI